jgi:hypothetical protein
MPEENASSDSSNQSEHLFSTEYANPIREEGKSNTMNGDLNGKDKSPHWADRIMAIFTVLIFFTYITSDYFLWRQLGATRDALTQAKQDNANAITAQQTIAQNALTASQSNFERSSKDAQDSFRQDQRPWLSIKDITCGTCETIGGSFHGGNLYDWITTIRNLKTKVVNTGKTPAEDVRMNGNVHVGGISYNFTKCAATPGGCSLFQYDSRNLRNFQDRGRAGTFPVPPMDIGSIGPTQEKPVILITTNPAHTIGLTREYEASVYVEGTISYHSAWGSSGETKFCFFPKLSRSPTTNKEPANEEPANDNYCDNPGSNTMR